MSWILKNKFLVVLITCTVVVAGALLYLGTRASGKYADHKQEFDQAASQVATYERLALYPEQPNLDAKTKAVADFEKSINDLKESFASFIPEPREAITPQEFGNRLIATNEVITKRLRESNVTLPTAFYSGFEAYTGTLAQSASTSVLDFQLSVVESLMADLAEAKPSAIVNFRRESQPEESGGKYEQAEDEVVRPHAFELSLLGTEASARRFLTSLVDLEKRFAVIRVIRITSESTIAPKPSDTLFSAPATAAATGAGNPFGASGFFGAFGDAFTADDEPADEAPEGEENAEAAPIAPPTPAPPTDGTRILGQVAGNEMIHVFLRFEVLEVLASEKEQPSDES